MVRRCTVPNSTLEVSPFCYGTGSWGTDVSGAALDRLFNIFLESGGNFFDTAHCYAFWVNGGLGASERALGDCVRKYATRNDVVIATKGGHPDGGPAYRRPDRFLAPEVIASDITDSLERLRIDAIDLYYLHRDDRRVPVGEIVESLAAEAGQRRIRYAGASNWTTARIAEANAYAAARGLPGFVASQPQWSLAHPNPISDPTARFLISEDYAWHVASQLAVVPYSPTACGYFGSNGQRGADAFGNETSIQRLQRARHLADAMDRGANQIALAYLLNQPFRVFPILGTTDEQHLREALIAAVIELSPSQLCWLRDGDVH